MYEYRAAVEDVHDGDTIRVTIDLGFSIKQEHVTLRLYGINAPELRTRNAAGVLVDNPAGVAARDFLASLIPVGSQVYLRTVKDRTEKYGRYLSNVWPGLFVSTPTVGSVNQVMVDTGHAVEYLP